MALDTSSMEDTSARPRILALMDGKPGHEHQTEGILLHLPECSAVVVRLAYPSKRADNALRAKVAIAGKRILRSRIRTMLASALTEESYAAVMNVEPPDLVLSTGSSLAAPNVLLAKWFGAKSVVCTRPSPIGLRPFDLAILPRHQWPAAELARVVRVLGVPTHITPERVAERRRELEAAGGSVVPSIGLLFGGDDKRYRWTVELAQRVVEVLISVASQTDFRLAVATSRRTPPEVESFIRARLEESPVCAYAAFASDPAPKEEPVLTILAMSAWVAVTVDSFSMVCEAASSGLPVGLIEIPPRRSDKYAPTYDAIAEVTRLRRMPLDTLYEIALSFVQASEAMRETEPLRDAATAANGIRQLLGLPTG